MIQPWARILLFFMVSFFLVPLSAQDAGEWYVNKPIEDIRFTNLSRVSQNDLDSVVTPFRGMIFTETVFQDLQRRLYALDYFEYLLPLPIPTDDQNSGVILEFEVLERPVIGSIEFAGMRRIRENQLRDVVLGKIGDVYSLPRIRTDRESLLNHYKSKGYPQAQVEFEVSDLDNGDKGILFTIVEGPQTTVREILFQGNGFGTSSALKARLSSKEQALFNSGLFQESLLAADQEAIITFYEENGFVDAEVLDVQTEFELSEDGLQSSVTLTFIIDEGQRWSFGGVEFIGNEIFSDETLGESILLQPGDILDLVKLRTSLQQVVDVYYQNGYFNNQIDFQETRNEEFLSLSYSIVIVEQARSYIENIIIRGNEKTEDRVIRRELPFETGDVFSASRIREGLLNVFNLQYFEGVPVIETPEGSQPELRDVIITVEEARTLDVRGGFSVGGEGFPLAIIASVSDINFLGNGQNLGVQLNLSSLTQSITANFSDNYLFGDRIGGGVSLTLDRSLKQDVPQDFLGPVFFGSTFVPDPYTSEAEYLAAGGLASIPDEYLMEYIEWGLSLGFNFNMRRRFAPGWLGLTSNIRTRLNFIEYDSNLYRPALETTRNNLDDFDLINQLGVGVSLDNRDVFFNPSSGYYFNQNVLFTGGFLFGSRHYIRTESTAQGFFTLFHTGDEPIGNFRLVLALNSNLTFMLPQFWVANSGATFQPGSDLLAINGMNIARGWDPNEVGRKNGEALWNNWIELRMPIVESVLWSDTYVEAVRLTLDREDIFSAGGNGWMFGFGTGLRLAIPQLPISLFLAKRFEISDSGSLVWQDGNLFPGEDGEGKGIDLIFAINFFN